MKLTAGNYFQESFLYLFFQHISILKQFSSIYWHVVDRKRRDNELKVRKQRSETPYLFETGRERGSGGGNVRTTG